MDEVRLIVLSLNEVAFLDTLCELVLTDSFNLTYILNVRVDVDEGPNSIHFPIGNHAIPVIVVVTFQLPVPDQARALRVRVLANPVLHPNAAHGQSTGLHHRVLFIDKLLTTDDSNDSALESPLGQGPHRADSLRQGLSKRKWVLTPHDRT